jgi:hypothetical protein
MSDTEIRVKESIWLILPRTSCFSCFRLWYLRRADCPDWDSLPQWVMRSRPYKISFGLSKDVIRLKSDSSSTKSQLTKLQQSVDIQFKNKDCSTAGSLSPQSVRNSHKDVARTPPPPSTAGSLHAANMAHISLLPAAGTFAGRAWFVSQVRHISRSRSFQSLTKTRPTLSASR